MNANGPRPLRQIQVVRHPVGLPDVADFALAQALPPPRGPDEIRVRVQWLSIDPYLRPLLAGRYFLPRPEIGAPVPGTVLGTVLESDNAAVPVGAQVVCDAHWAEEVVVRADAVRVVHSDGFPDFLHLGPMGITGLTAWTGLRVIAPPQPGQTVVVSAAAGGVGSLALQLARWSGARVVGIVGGEDKARAAREVFGMDACISHAAPDFVDALHGACPDGIDVYFDNVGGRVLEAVIGRLARNARIVLCGMMEQYNADRRLPGPNLGPVVAARASLTGLVVYDHLDRMAQMQAELAARLARGELHHREDIHDGLAAAPAAFCAQMRGGSFGKVLVRLTEGA